MTTDVQLLLMAEGHLNDAHDHADSAAIDIWAKIAQRLYDGLTPAEALAHREATL